MKLAANRKNLKAHARALLGAEWTAEKERELIRLCLAPLQYMGAHPSFARRDRLGEIDTILGTCGVEGMLLNEYGEDQAGTCDEANVELDIQYCNTGDTYGMTIMFVNGKLCIGDWGSLVERLGEGRAV